MKLNHPDTHVSKIYLLLDFNIIWLSLLEVLQNIFMLNYIGQEWNCWGFSRTIEGMGKAM